MNVPRALIDVRAGAGALVEKSIGGFFGEQSKEHGKTGRVRAFSVCVFDDVWLYVSVEYDGIDKGCLPPPPSAPTRHHM